MSDGQAANARNRQKWFVAAGPPGSVKVVRDKGLTPREREVALLLERNLSDDEIARKLGIKRGTVKIHVRNILIKLNARDRHDKRIRNAASS